MTGINPAGNSRYTHAQSSVSASAANHTDKAPKESPDTEANTPKKQAEPPSLWQRLKWRVQSVFRVINLASMKWGNPYEYENRRLTVIHELGHTLAPGKEMSPFLGIGLQGTYKHFLLACDFDKTNKHIAFSGKNTKALTCHEKVSENLPISSYLKFKLGSVAALIDCEPLRLKPDLFGQSLSLAEKKRLERTSWLSFGHDLKETAETLLQHPDLIVNESDKQVIEKVLANDNDSAGLSEEEQIQLYKDFIQLESVRPHFEAASEAFEGITGKQWQGISETVLQRGVVRGPQELKTLCDKYFGANKVAVAMPQQLDTAA